MTWTADNEEEKAAMPPAPERVTIKVSGQAGAAYVGPAATPKMMLQLWEAPIEQSPPDVAYYEGGNGVRTPEYT